MRTQKQTLTRTGFTIESAHRPRNKAGPMPLKWATTRSPKGPSKAGRTIIKSAVVNVKPIVQAEMLMNRQLYRKKN